MRAAVPHSDTVHHRFEPPIGGRHVFQFERQIVDVVQSAAPKELRLHPLLLRTQTKEETEDVETG